MQAETPRFSGDKIMRTRGAFGLGQVHMLRSFNRELRVLGIEPGKRLAQMWDERRRAGDWKGELCVMEIAHRYVSTPKDRLIDGELVAAGGQLQLVGWSGGNIREVRGDEVTQD